MKKLLIALLLIAAWVAPTVAQDVPPIRLVVGEGAEKPIVIRAVESKVVVQGMLAETRLTMTFFNPNGRRLAGDLTFPLPEGATVSGYGLDVNGVLVDGVVVEKQKGREVFETEMRRGVDPGLIEKVKGNSFQTRVYPIEANGVRTVMVKYVSSLAEAGGESLYILPLSFDGQVEKFNLRVEVARGSVKPEIRAGSLSNFSFETWKNGFAAETSLEKAALSQTLRIAIPDAKAQRVLVEKSPEGDTHFCLSETVEPPADLPAMKLPSRVTILWDASGSRAKGDRKAEFEVLRAAFAAWKSAPVEVELVPFRNVPGKPETMTVSNGDVAGLLKAIEAVEYDGGTQLGALPPSGDKLPDVYLMFTDGISNFGREEPGKFAAPLYVFSGDAGANHAFLGQLALQNGGEYVNLQRVKPEEAVKGIGRPVYMFLGAEGAGADDLVPQLQKSARGRFEVAGRLTGGEAKIILKFGTVGKVMKTVEFDVKAADAGEGDLLRRFWAQKKLEDLEAFPAKNEKAMIALGKRYSIVTPQTSLIVLERPEQYIEHEIVPPANMAEWRKQYFDVMERRASELKEAERGKLEEMLSLWNNRINWYKTDFAWTGQDKLRMKQSIGRADSLESGGVRREMSEASEERLSMPMPGAPPAPSRAMSAPSAEPDAAQSDSFAGGAGAESKKADASRDDGNAARPVEPGVAMKAWTPDTPYLKRIKAAGKGSEFAAYQKEKAEFGSSPAFYLDCSDFFYGLKQDAIGLQVLSNLAELKLENPALMRILAHRLAQRDLLELSAGIFEEVLKMRPEEPQSYRDLGLVLGRMGAYERAVSLLWDVVAKKRWDGRFREIELMALEEMNNLIAKAKAAGIKEFKGVDPRFIHPMQLDLRIVMTWDADMTDMDLWVNEPSGEKAYYGYNRTGIGGLVSCDFTQGYGPEEYLLKKAMKGMYTIQTNFFGSNAQTLSGAVTLQVDVFTNYGRPNEKRRSITMRLTERKETFTVGEVEF
ncbi:MAG TPA: VIT domain-containing protein [Candidatus Ozemobacteraceae bacterium]|nr:VIT domain-containing protein [Candidatus Ozemobacteraceae bacterium]